MPFGLYAEMPPLTDEELQRKSDPTRVDVAYKDFDPADRIVFSPDEWVEMVATLGHIVLPVDEKSNINLPPRGHGAPLTVVTSVSEADKALWKSQGYTLDQFGDRINPRAEQVMTTPGFGMFTGWGKYWGLGPNAIGNLGIFTGDAYLMTCSDRGKGDVWGLPGGHNDPKKDKTLAHTARREAVEETGVPEEYIDQLCEERGSDHFVQRDWPQPDRGATALAWQEGETRVYEDPDFNRVLGHVTLGPLDLEENIKEVALVPLEVILSGKLNVMSSHLSVVRAHQLYLARRR